MLNDSISVHPNNVNCIACLAETSIWRTGVMTAYESEGLKQYMSLLSTAPDISMQLGEYYLRIPQAAVYSHSEFLHPCIYMTLLFVCITYSMRGTCALAVRIRLSNFLLLIQLWFSVSCLRSADRFTLRQKRFIIFKRDLDIALEFEGNTTCCSLSTFQTFLAEENHK